MGLFDKKSKTFVEQTTDTDNIGLTDIDDSVALAGVSDSDIEVNVLTTDQGALDVAENIAVEGFDVIGDAFNENIELTRDVLSSQDAANERTAITLAEGTREALGFGESALDFADRSQVEAFAFGTDALDLVDGLASQSFDLASDLAEGFSEVTSEQAGQLRGAIADIQARESGNTDARLGDITRVALFVAGGIAIVAIGLPLLRGRKGGR